VNINNLLLTKLSITPWTIHPNMLDVIENVITNNISGIDIKLPNVELDKATQVRERGTLINYQVINGKAVIPLHGVVLKKSMGMEGCSGMETTLRIDNTLKHAVDNADVKEIILDIDSPGGTSDGIEETAELIYEIRDIKPIVAYANGMMCSAAYWLGSAASKIYLYGTTEVGSIGVYMMHVDYSRQLDNAGVKVTYIKAGKYKAIGNPHEPLGETGREKLQEMVDYTYSSFVNAVARYRNISVETVLDKMADARIFMGQQAVDVGLADEIRNFDGLIDESYIYSFLKGDSMSIFGKKTEENNANSANSANTTVSVTTSTLEQELAKAKADLESTKTELELVKQELNNLKTSIENSKKIRAFALKMNQSVLGEQLINEGKSIEEAYDSIASVVSAESTSTLADVKKAFEQTASQIAGGAGAANDELDGETPTTQESAMKYCQKKYNCSKVEAWKHARREFTNLFRQQADETK
jgi:signal peptide peptidase SppA